MANDYYAIQILDNDNIWGGELQCLILPSNGQHNHDKFTVTHFTNNAVPLYYQCKIGSDVTETIQNLKTQIDNYHNGAPSLSGPNYITTITAPDTLKVELIDPDLVIDAVNLRDGLAGSVFLERPIDPALVKPTVPYFKLPEANSLSFALVKDYNNRDVYKNVFNSKSSQANTNLVDCMIQNFHWEDKIITQLRTNYDNITATITDEEGNVDNINVDLKVHNLEVTQTIDAVQVATPDELGMILFFRSGNIYEYETSNVVDSHQLEGQLPEWAVAGNWVKVGGNHVEIIGVHYDSSEDRHYMVLDTYPLFVIETDIVVSSMYNREDYNVYEFTVNAYDKEGKLNNVQLQVNDSREGFIDVEYSSENIFIDSEYNKDDYGSQNRIELVYFNYENSSDINFSTGFYGILRLDYIDFIEDVDHNVDTEKKSNTVISLSSSNYHQKVLSLERIPAIYFRKLIQAFSMKEIFLDRIQYSVKDIDHEWIQGTNSYSMEITLYCAENGFNPLADRRYCGDRYIAPNIEGGLDSELDFEI